MSLLKVGDTAPNFSLPDAHGQFHSLSEQTGKWVVAYFYPKASTPGCTTQACNIRDHHSDFAKLGITVFGISPDSPAKLLKFSDNQNLNFTLLGDEEKTTLQAYGVWQQKSMFGNKYMGVVRSTYIISPEGKIAHVIAKASPSTHSEQLLTWFKKNS